MHRKLVLIAAIACASFGATASAGATPVALTFDHVLLATPSLAVSAVSPATPPLSVTADLDGTTGDFTVAPADWHFPVFHFTAPIAGSIDVELDGPATGHVDVATGRVTFDGAFAFAISTASFGDCTEHTPPLSLTTETTRPRPGQAFPAGADAFATGTGAFGVGWDGGATPSGAGCATIDPVVNGPGGLWISRGIASSSGTTGTGGGGSTGGGGGTTTGSTTTGGASGGGGGGTTTGTTTLSRNGAALAALPRFRVRALAGRRPRTLGGLRFEGLPTRATVALRCARRCSHRPARTSHPRRGLALRPPVSLRRTTLLELDARAPGYEPGRFLCIAFKGRGRSLHALVRKTGPVPAGEPARTRHCG